MKIKEMIGACLQNPNNLIPKIVSVGEEINYLRIQKEMLGKINPTMTEGLDTKIQERALKPARSICLLNSIRHNQMIDKKVDLNNPEACLELVDDFMSSYKEFKKMYLTEKA